MTEELSRTLDILPGLGCFRPRKLPSGADSISAKRVGPSTFDATLKQAGKVIGTSKVEVSADGKVTTVTSKGTNATGQATKDVSVYNKQ